MFYYPDLNPEIFNFHGISIKWYGVCHVIALLLFYWRANQCRPKKFTHDNISDLVFYLCLGLLFGGKFGYILFYFPKDIFIHPLSLVTFWLPGRSFHGGLLGVIIAIYLYAKKYKFSFWEIADFIAPIIPLGICCGRIGNFINGELWGRVTNVPWGMIFWHVDNLPRHPSQLYEFFLEGVLLFIILNFVVNLKLFARFDKIVQNKAALFLILYAIFRIFVENYREPDLEQGFIAGVLTMGQILSLPMLIGGCLIVWFRSTRGEVVICKNI